ncbi:uncharacterized protein [Nicotiana tomentosiformis]|uniref:uncharacterized protein n=1 Tax=Nicotiana tomentosiformis TaxID=4098 RepID=UPI00388CDAC2
MWATFKECFDKVNGSRPYYLRKEIFAMTQGISFFSTYFTKLRDLWAEYDSILPPPPAAWYVEQLEYQHLLQFLMGLSHSFEKARSQLLLLPTLPSINKAYAMLVQDESRRMITGSNYDLLFEKVKEIGKEDDGLYVLSSSVRRKVNRAFAVTSGAGVNLWHKQIGHVPMQYCKPIKVFRSDKEVEFFNHSCKDLFQLQGIIHQSSCSYTSQQNGVVERRHRHILESIKAIKFQGHLLVRYWGHCIDSVVYIINLIPSSILAGKSLYEMLHGKQPSISHLRVIGCLCFATNLIKHGKFKPRAVRSVLLAYAAHQTGYMLLDLEHSVFFISRDIVFYEDIFPFQSLDLGSSDFLWILPMLLEWILFIDSTPIAIQHLAVIHTHGQEIRKSGRVSKPPIWMQDYVPPTKEKYVVAANILSLRSFKALDHPSNGCVQYFCKTKDDLQSSFKIKDLGELKYFLGIEFTRSDKRILMHQRKYALELISDLGLAGSTHVYSLIEQNLKLTTIEFDDHIASTGDSILSNPGPYQRLLGKLLYLTITRPDILFAAQCLSQFMHKPKTSHMEDALRVVRFVKSSPSLSVLLSVTCSYSLSAFCDVDWAAFPNTRMSITRYFVKFGNSLISWKSKRQSAISRSSA